MSRIRYCCHSCGAIAALNNLKRSTWGDPCCPACGSLDLERYRSRGEDWYARFFLFKVY